MTFAVNYLAGYLRRINSLRAARANAKAYDESAQAIVDRSS